MEQVNALSLQNTNNDLMARISTLSEQLEIARATTNRRTVSPLISAETRDAIHKYRGLIGTHDKLSRDYSNALEEVCEAQGAKNLYLVDLHQVRRERDSAKSRVRKLVSEKNRLEAANKSLEEEKEELEEELERLDPIVQIGVDVRLRNLEWARETALGVPTNDMDRAIIRKGNIAAHRANGAVDAALFENDLVPKEYIEEASRVFEEMYEVAPSDIGQWLPKALRFTDCQATFRTHKAIKSGDSQDLRKEYKNLEDCLIGLYNLLPSNTSSQMRL